MKGAPWPDLHAVLGEAGCHPAVAIAQTRETHHLFDDALPSPPVRVRAPYLFNIARGGLMDQAAAGARGWRSASLARRGAGLHRSRPLPCDDPLCVRREPDHLPALTRGVGVLRAWRGWPMVPLATSGD